MTYPETLVALYPGDRGSGKTTRIVEQVTQATLEGQSVAVVSPNQTDRRRLDIDIHAALDSFTSQVPCFTEVSFSTGRSRGLRLDHVFVDDADRFDGSAAELVDYFHPGVPLTMTYTPRDVRR